MTPRRVGVVILAMASVAVGVAGCGSEPPALVGVEHTTVYCHDGGQPQILDVYEPAGVPTHPVPAVVDVHGGGWILGDARLVPSSVDGRVEAALVGQGWVFVSIDYRLAPTSPWPAQIEDAKCAVRYLRAHAAALHVDPAHVGAIGASAGGQLVSLLGLAGPGAGFDVGAYPGRSSGVQAVVDEYGPTDLTSPVWRQGSPAIRVLAQKTFGVAAGQPSPVLAAASPVTYVTRGAPPFLVVQGARDAIVPPSQSRELVERLHAAADRASLVMVAHAGHGLIPTGGSPQPDAAEVAGRVTAFFDRSLGARA